MIRIKNNTPARLPSEYQEVEYLEDSGTQHINTGVQNSSAITFVVEKAFEGSTDKQCGVDYIYSSTRYRMRAGTDGSGYLYYGYNTTNYALTTKPESGKWYRFTLGNGIQKVEDIASATVLGSSTITMSRFGTLNILLFRWYNDNNGGIGSGTGASRIRSCKIYDNDTLIRDFVPCYRKSDNEAGMYDLVNNVFYTNAGTGTFLRGGVAQNTARDLNIEPEMVKTNPNPLRLPADYQEVEYIESTGTQYIDTGVNGTAKGTYEIKFNMLGKEAISYEQYFAGDGTSNKTGKLFTHTSNSCVNIQTNGTSTKLFNIENVVHTVSVTDTAVLVDGVSKTSYTPGAWGTLTYYVFNAHGEPNLMSSMRLYYLKMYSDGVLVRNFIPCYRKSDNVAGLYDLVNGTFYTNAGSGTFTIGNEVIYRPFVLSPLPRGYIQDKLFYGEAPKQGRFVAVTSNQTKAYYSDDGETWATGSTNTYANLKGVTYGNDRFVSVGESGKSYYSLDGSTWSSMSGLNTSYTYYAVTYANGRFVCVGASGKSYYSTDGTTWVAMTGLNTSRNFYCVTYGNGMFVCGGVRGEIYYSTDGTTWTLGNTGAKTGSGYNIEGMAYGNGMFVCCYGTTGFNYYSLDGKNWSIMSGMTETYCTEVTYGKDRFVAVGNNGHSYYSLDGVNWVAMTGLKSASYYGVAYGNDRFVAVGSSGKAGYSTDGVNWVEMTGLGSTYTYTSVCYGKV